MGTRPTGMKGKETVMGREVRNNEEEAAQRQP